MHLVGFTIEMLLFAGLYKITAVIFWSYKKLSESATCKTQLQQPGEAAIERRQSGIDSKLENVDTGNI